MVDNREETESEYENEADRPEQSDGKDPLKNIKSSRVILPILIGLVVVGYMFYRDFDVAIFDIVDFSWRMVFWLVVAVIFIAGRDLGYIIRIMVLSKGDLTWRQAFRVIMLWEFTSAVTPAAAGGTSIALLFVHKEGISIGRSTAIVLVTSFLDELYFIVMFPLVVLIAGVDNVFSAAQDGSVFERGLMWFAVIGYAIKFLYLIFITYGLFINPRGLKWLLMKIFKWRPLKRWRRAMNKIGTDLVEGSVEMKKQGVRFWSKALLSTFLSWSSRFLVANALIMAFFGVNDHVMLFCKQLVMWVMMLVMPTPGGSGFAEAVFSTYTKDLIAVAPELQLAAAMLIAVLWRVVTYYPYLIVGAIIVPKWIGTKFGKKSKQTKNEKS